MRPVQVYLAMRKRTVNLNSGEAAMASAYPRDVGNSEAAIQFRQVQNSIHIAFVEKSENSSRRPWHAILTAIANGYDQLTVWSHENRRQKCQSRGSPTPTRGASFFDTCRCIEIPSCHLPTEGKPG